jgi:parvulin-like peptidyl-prolyl isomerase
MILTSLLLLAPLALPTAPQAQVQPAESSVGEPREVDRLAVIINDQVLTMRQILVERDRWANQQGIDPDTAGLVYYIARQAVLDMLFREGYRQTGLEEGMIDQVVREEILRRTETAGSAIAYAHHLELQGTTLEKEREKIKQMLIATFYQQAELGIAPQLGSKNFQAFLHVPPSEIRKYYNNNSDEFTSPHMAKARILLVLDSSVPDSEAAIFDLQERTTDGPSFAALCQEHSDYSRTQESLTPMRDVDKFAFAAPLKDFLRTAKTGDFSEPIELATGWALVHVIEVQEARELSVGEAHLLIENKLLRLKQNKALQETVDRLQERCFVWLTPELEGIFTDVYGAAPEEEEEL